MSWPTDTSTRVGPTIERLWPDCCRVGQHGPAFVREIVYEQDYTYGSVKLRSLPVVLPDPATALVGTELAGFPLREALFLDTETTGLSGGTGTYVFLVGAGRFMGGRFVFRQFFLRELHEERALLHAVQEFAIGCQGLVTFNGRCFDLPLLQNRHTLQRLPMRLPADAHLDLLWPSRRVWSRRLPSCALTSLERAVLGEARVGDVPGELIPELYFRYLRTRDVRALIPVIEHNRRDVVALAALSAVLCALVMEPVHCECHPVDLVALGRLYLRQRDLGRAERCYQQALAGALPRAERGWALLGLAEVLGRSGRTDAALPLLQAAARQGGPAGLEAAIRLAKHLEHQMRDYAAAVVVTAQALDCAPDQRSRPELLRRMERLQRKRARGTPPAGDDDSTSDTGGPDAFPSTPFLAAGAP